ncbi:type IV secretory system conjugative DNA transfer family protein [Nocardia terpenica]|uniref:TraM recognition domain-containing protein n=1 Tax=Nocardia terpenica TaxID=455432 RepID=A0A6G9ZDF2_9NOCA|nr:TraM recognition domain-containing protein [Nocardia terpenica]QIS23645.1 TraM recognition domain-containing protein [Nocardia terpenica]
MTSTDRPVYPGDNTAGLVAVGLVILGWIAASVTAWAALLLAAADPVNPLMVLPALGFGRQRWPSAATGWTVVLAAAQAGAMVWACWRWWHRRAGQSRFDYTTEWLARPREVVSLRAATTRALSQQLGMRTPWAGVPLGALVTQRGAREFDKADSGRQSEALLYSDCEKLSVDIWGPRRGKTTARVIPAILGAPGPVLTTSNKRDVVDATRGVREKVGTVHIFDPQNLLDQRVSRPSMTWDPLSAIRMGDRKTWDVRAEKLADIFMADSFPPGAAPDPFFDPEGRDLLAKLFLAAALGQQPASRVFEWITEPSPAPLKYLRESEFTSSTSALRKFIGYSDRQKDGLFGTAKKMCNVLGRLGVNAWLTPHPGLPEFTPAQFVHSRDTLYLLSQEGVDSASALTTALTWAVCDAAERLGDEHGVRLPVPLVAALDELANTVRWPDLPEKFSHYGSRGIIIMAVLQNWSQGVRAYGAAGMQQMWDAAAIRYYGGGVADPRWLGDVSELIGIRFEQSRSINHSTPAGLTGSGQMHVSVNRDVREHKILTPAQLSQLPKGRALVLWDGRPVMVRPVPWWERPYADQVRESLARYGPKDQVEQAPERSVRSRVRGVLARARGSDGIAAGAVAQEKDVTP